MAETQDKKIYILIAAFNESKQIGSVILGLKSSGYDNILVVNDGSGDNTAEIAEKSGAEVLNHIINRGQGAALRTGLEYLREAYDPDIIITFDADGQHRAEDIANLIKPLIEENVDIVLGSRFLENTTNIQLLRKIILKAGVHFTNILSNVKLTDTHNGFRALSRKAIALISITHRKMEHASDIIDEISKNKLTYKEVPVEIIYTDYSKQKGTNKNIDFIKIGIKLIIKKLQ